MKIGCFALMNPFSTLDAQFEAIRAMGFDLLIEPHGIVSDSVDATTELLERLGHPEWFA